MQAHGAGQAMIVADPALHPDAWCAGMPDLVICEWMDEGYKRDAVHYAKDLEMVGSQPRQSREEVYNWITTRTIETITALVADGEREMARGALRLWEDCTRKYAQDTDLLRMQQLIDRASAIGSPQ